MTELPHNLSAPARELIRVLVVDDSPTSRALLVSILRGDTRLQVVGEAADGSECAAMAARLRPDVITMDINMPGTNGYEATRRIMTEMPTPIVMVTGADPGEVRHSLDAMEAGALSVLYKPEGPLSSGFPAAARYIAETVASMAEVRVVRRNAMSSVPPRVTPTKAHGARKRIVALATSTGGPQAVKAVTSALPGSFAAPILIVQHISAGFLQEYVRWLQEGCALRVRLGEDGCGLAPGTIFIAPEARHMGAAPDGVVRLWDGEAIGGFRPSATYLFESVANSFGADVLAVILTGMGVDGVEGLQAVRAAHGHVIAQDEATSVVFGMPGAAVKANCVNEVVPLPAIADRLCQLTALLEVE